MPVGDKKFEALSLISPPSDAHGQAALVLVETLIHALVERSILTTRDGVEIVESAIEVQAEVAEAANGSGEKMWQSYTLLSEMAQSLKYDLEDPDEQKLR